MAQKIILPVFKLKQPTNSEKSIFVGQIKVEELIDETQFKIHYWDPKKKNLKDQGYQRKPSEIRAIKIAKYIEEEADPIFPTTILINSRKPLNFELEDKKSNVGKLILGKSPGEYPMWIVDGQHRIAGLKYAIEKMGLKAWKKIELPVVFLSNFKTIEEANQFYILNTTQKKVATDLAQRLISDIVKEKPGEYDKLVGRGTDWEVRALVVVDLLNEKPGSPWEGRIRLPNSSKTASNIINQTSFVKSLKPLFKDGLFSTIRDADMSYKILRNYWMAFKRIFPDAFLVPKEYVIQKTPGIFSLHELAHKILLKKGENCTSESDFISILKKVFSDQEEYGPDFWRADADGAASYGSMKGFRILATKFTENLPWS